MFLAAFIWGLRQLNDALKPAWLLGFVLFKVHLHPRLYLRFGFARALKPLRQDAWFYGSDIPPKPKQPPRPLTKSHIPLHLTIMQPVK